MDRLAESQSGQASLALLEVPSDITPEFLQELPPIEVDTDERQHALGELVEHHNEFSPDTESRMRQLGFTPESINDVIDNILRPAVKEAAVDPNANPVFKSEDEIVAVGFLVEQGSHSGNEKIQNDAAALAEIDSLNKLFELEIHDGHEPLTPQEHIVPDPVQTRKALGRKVRELLSDENNETTTPTEHKIPTESDLAAARHLYAARPAASENAPVEQSITERVTSRFRERKAERTSSMTLEGFQDFSAALYAVSVQEGHDHPLANRSYDRSKERELHGHISVATEYPDHSHTYTGKDAVVIRDALEATAKQKAEMEARGEQVPLGHVVASHVLSRLVEGVKPTEAEATQTAVTPAAESSAAKIALGEAVVSLLKTEKPALETMQDTQPMLRAVAAPTEEVVKSPDLLSADTVEHVAPTKLAA